MIPTPDLLQSAIALLAADTQHDEPSRIRASLLRVALTELAAYRQWSLDGFKLEGSLYGNWVAAHQEVEKTLKAFLGGAA